jgi:hypothetical protein
MREFIQYYILHQKEKMDYLIFGNSKHISNMEENKDGSLQYSLNENKF